MSASAGSTGLADNTGRNAKLSVIKKEKLCKTYLFHPLEIVNMIAHGSPTYTAILSS